MSTVTVELATATRAEPRRSLLVACASLELLALAVWIGGLVVIVGSVIPAVFNTFGMEAGGRFLTRVFTGYNRLLVGAGAVLLVTGAWRYWIARRAPAAALSRAEGTVTALMLGLAALIMLVFGPESVRLQEAAFAAQGEAARKAAYEAFFRVHHLVRALYVLTLGLAVALTVLKVRRWLTGTIATGAGPDRQRHDRKDDERP